MLVVPGVPQQILQIFDNNIYQGCYGRSILLFAWNEAREDIIPCLFRKGKRLLSEMHVLRVSHYHLPVVLSVSFGIGVSPRT